LSIDFESILLPNDLIIIRNYEENEEDIGESFRGVEDKHEHSIHVGDQSNSEFLSLTTSPTRSPRPPHLNLDV
jgi:hypothetical protein